MVGAVTSNLRLSNLLARAYSASVLRKELVAAVRADFDAAMTDPDFALAARHRLAGLTERESHVERLGGPGTLGKRDFVAKVQIDVLREWLDDE